MSIFLTTTCFEVNQLEFSCCARNLQLLIVTQSRLNSAPSSRSALRSRSAPWTASRSLNVVSSASLKNPQTSNNDYYFMVYFFHMYQSCSGNVKMPKLENLWSRFCWTELLIIILVVSPLRELPWGEISSDPRGPSSPTPHPPSPPHLV